MRDYRCDFDLTPGHVWFNSASEGPLPKVSAQALAQAVAWKSSPEKLTIPKFQQIPIELKQSIARFCQLPADEIIVGNSATYGIHLLANGLIFNPDDEIIVMCNDFPTDILPWLHLKEKGVIVHQLKAKGAVLNKDEVKNAINSRTRLICLPLVHTFSGWRLDIKEIGKLAQEHGILCVLNMSQAFGAFKVDISKLSVDAVVCAGYKWLLGPYGTGFCWVNKNILNQLRYPQAYWISLMEECSLNSTAEISLPDDKTVRRYDVFATANFFNYVPWIASLNYLNGIGIDQIEAHNMALINLFCDGLDMNKYVLISPQQPKERSNIVVFSHQDTSLNSKIFDYLKEHHFHLAFWKGNMRLSPHLFNNAEEILKLLEVLNTYDAK